MQPPKFGTLRLGEKLALLSEAESFLNVAWKPKFQVGQEVEALYKDGDEETERQAAENLADLGEELGLVSPRSPGGVLSPKPQQWHSARVAAVDMDKRVYRLTFRWMDRTATVVEDEIRPTSLAAFDRALEDNLGGDLIAQRLAEMRIDQIQSPRRREEQKETDGVIASLMADQLQSPRRGAMTDGGRRKSAGSEMAKAFDALMVVNESINMPASQPTSDTQIDPRSGLQRSSSLMQLSSSPNKDAFSKPKKPSGRDSPGTLKSKPTSTEVEEVLEKPVVAAKSDARRAGLQRSNSLPEVKTEPGAKNPGSLQRRGSFFRRSSSVKSPERSPRKGLFGGRSARSSTSTGGEDQRSPTDSLSSPEVPHSGVMPSDAREQDQGKGQESVDPKKSWGRRSMSRLSRKKEESKPNPFRTSQEKQQATDAAPSADSEKEPPLQSRKSTGLFSRKKEGSVHVDPYAAKPKVFRTSQEKDEQPMDSAPSADSEKELPDAKKLRSRKSTGLLSPKKEGSVHIDPYAEAKWVTASSQEQRRVSDSAISIDMLNQVQDLRGLGLNGTGSSTLKPRESKGRGNTVRK